MLITETKYCSRVALNDGSVKLRRILRWLVLRWEVCNHSLQKVEGLALVGLQCNQLLEDTENRLELLVLKNVLSTTRDDRRQKAYERRNVASFRIPHNRQKDGRDQILIVIGQGSGWIGFQESGEELEHVGHEFSRKVSLPNS